ncbi:hypothetical protein L228DRAFT_246553 [Xylona heveae TC161]|uniref:pH-response regulator protein palC n=1 Tax=Xylona heveae (strain CBS 132557 / TC161) TaxID=1328760 RepID=A0A165HLW2_XYLHT|nr:hypothetical protein L228DRAFT_246553 [Xylona heveae TC161]KZF23712.1 hypothetical protein L228DRAFT_246553 [Xylona heveae TC161]
MPYPFSLPTTSQVSFTSSLSSSTHPSLPLTATTYRGVLRNTLKRHKRLPPGAQSSGLSHVLGSLNDYIPYLFALDCGLSGTPISTLGNDEQPNEHGAADEGEEVDIILHHEVETEWRATLSSSSSFSRPMGSVIERPRVKLHSLEYELFFVLSTLATTYTLLARSQLHILYGGSPFGTTNPDSVLQCASPSPEARTTAITTATKYFLQANSIYNYLVDRAGRNTGMPPVAVADISLPALNALSSLAMAEATLLAVLKDDPYPAAVAQDRNKHDREWMIKAPDLPKVRAHLFARLCLAAADHASRAKAMLQSVAASSASSLSGGSGGSGGAKQSNSTKIDDSLIKYLDDLRRTARAKACRFFGIDADLSGRTGEAIGWLRAGKKELGLDDYKSGSANPAISGSSSSLGGGGSGGGFGRLKKTLLEKREDKKIEKGGDWGRDAGRFEEGRVNDMLEKKWVKMNDTISTQLVPPPDALLSQIPSGRDIHSPKRYVPPHLEPHVLAQMRAPLDPDPDPDSPSSLSPPLSPPSSSSAAYPHNTVDGVDHLAARTARMDVLNENESSSDDDEDDGVPGPGEGRTDGAARNDSSRRAGGGGGRGSDRRDRRDESDGPAPVGAFPGTTRGDYVGRTGTATGNGSGSGNTYY